MDGKAQVVILGLGGCYCTCCTAIEIEGKNADIIRQVFSIDWTIEQLHELFEDLVDPEDDENIRTVAGDYCMRFWMTGRPQTSQDITKIFPLTHAWIRVLSHIENLVFRINSNVRIMGRGKRIGVKGKERLRIAKEDFKWGSQKGPMHLKLDCPDSTGVGGSSDTSDTAQMAKKNADCWEGGP
jgi:hypothetical protein